MPNSNPLCQPVVPFPFDQFAPEKIEPAVDALFEHATKTLEKIECHGKIINFDTTFGAQESASETIE